MTYLKPWASKRSKKKYWVHLHDKSKNKSEERRTDKIMKETDIYTIFLEDGKRDLKWEHKFRDLENEYAISRDRTESLGLISGENDRAVFLRFLSAQVHRTPSMRNHLKQFLQQVEYIINTLKIEKPFIFNPENPKSYSTSEITLALENPMTYILLPEMEFFSSLVEDMNISLLRTDTHPGFVTSDHPVAFRNLEPPHARIVLLNVASPTKEILMPMSPKICLLFTRDKKQNINFGDTVSPVHEINNTFIKMAQRYVVSRSSKVQFMPS